MPLRLPPRSRKRAARAVRVRSDFHKYLGGLQQAEAANGASSKPVIAYFDLDRTLISGYSITALALEKMWSGLSPRRMLIHAGIFLDYGLGRSDYHGLLKATVGALAGRPEREMIDLGLRAFERRLNSLIYDEARQLIEAHLSQQHEVVIITSATRYQAAPIARALGVQNLLCTELEIEEGLITGNVMPCYGEEKLHSAITLSRQQGAPLEEAYFYSDSEEDLPLLEAVGRPVAVNAKPALARIASQRGWTELVFAQQGDRADLAA